MTRQKNNTYKDENKAQVWQERYRIAVKNQQSLFRRFSRWFDNMYAVVNDENMALWRSKVYVPVLAGKAWNLIAKFVSLKPGFEVSLRDSNPMPDIPQELEEDPKLKKEYLKVENDRIAELKKRADKMQKKLEYDYDNPLLSETIRDKLLSVLVDASVTGTGIAKTPWVTKTRRRYERIVDDSGIVDLTKERLIEGKIGYNDLIPVNIFNVFVAPGSANLYDAPWIIIKEYKTLDQLKEAGVYSNLDKLENTRAGSDEFASYKKARNRLTNGQDPLVEDKTLDYIAVFECYEKNYICTYAEADNKGGNSGWVEIRKQRNPYWHGKYPLVRFVIKKRPYDFWGEGIFEITERLQSAINDVFNHYLDNWNLSVDGVWFTEESSNVNDFIIQPGGVITYRGTPPQPAKVPEPNPNSIQIVMQNLLKAIEDATISSYATGLPSSATDETRGTATGILRLQEAAGDIISFMRSNFQQSIKQIGQMWLSNNQQFLDQPVVINDKGRPLIINPEEIQGDMELRIDDASMEAVSKEDQKAAFLSYLQNTLQLQQASLQQAQALQSKPLEINFEELFKQLSEKFGIKSIDGLLITPEEKAEDVEEMQAQQVAEEQAMGVEQPNIQLPAEMQGGGGQPEEMLQEQPMLEGE